MPLEKGSLLGPYEIVAPLGAGGMGEVYKARDTRLERTVAIKVLPAHIAEHGDLRARFEREARAVSSLNHPHICALHDIGSHDGVSFMVLEHLEGETIAERLKRGALPLDAVLKYAIQIADALDRAHRGGVLHRDVKPANIMITRDGAKVLDFGLAKTSPAKTGPDDAAPTATIALEGSMVGTPHYMAPEQYSSQEADERSDIFAFGCVVYEMVTGRRTFDGKTMAGVAAAVVGSEPRPMSESAAAVPRQLERLVNRCLAKDPEERWQSIRDVLLELRSIGDAPETPAAAKRSRVWPAVAAVIVVAAGVLLALLLRSKPSPVPQQVRFYIDPPERLAALGFSVSPDGRLLAFSAGGKIWLRPLNALESRPLPGTEGVGGAPFWSPDNRFLAFRAAGKLKKIDIASGSVQSLCDFDALGFGTNGTWSRENVLLFSGARDGLTRVSAAGGATSTVRLTQSGSPRWPVFLPDGRHFLYRMLGEAVDGIYLGSLDSTGPVQSSEPVVARGQGIGLAATSDSTLGYVFYTRDTTLMAQPFHTVRLEKIGEPIPIAEDVLGQGPFAAFSVSPAGTLAYLTSSEQDMHELIWYDRSGKPLGAAGQPGPYNSVALDTDNGRVARSRGTGSRADIWVLDLSRGVDSRLTSDPSADVMPVWSPDGKWIVFASSRGGAANLYRKAADGSGQEQMLLPQTVASFPNDWSKDGRFLLFSRAEPTLDLWVMPMTGEPKPAPLLRTPAQEGQAKFSPDSRWIAYNSNESGHNEIYVLPFDPATGGSPGGKVQISVGGGHQPRWSHDGRELFYLSGLKVMSVSITPGTSFQAGTPKPLFEAPFWGGPASSNVHRWDVTADGKRFLINSSKEQPVNPPITVVVNWQSGLIRD